jgi:hypothetical protein
MLKKLGRGSQSWGFLEAEETYSSLRFEMQLGASLRLASLPGFLLSSQTCLACGRLACWPG